MGARRQKGKNRKRGRGWHQGRSASLRFLSAAAALPDTGAEVDLSLSVPLDARKHRRAGNYHRGEALS